MYWQDIPWNMHFCVNIFWLIWLIMNCSSFVVVVNIIVVHQLVSFDIFLNASSKVLFKTWVIFLLIDNRCKTIYWSVSKYSSRSVACKTMKLPISFTVCQFIESKCVIYSANLCAVRNKGICKKLTNFYCLFIDVKITSISGREPVGCISKVDLRSFLNYLLH